MDYKEIMYLNGREWYVKAIMNNETSKNLKGQFLQQIYHNYRNLRLAVGGAGCNKMSFLEVKQRLQDPSLRVQVQSELKLSDEEIELILSIAESDLQKLIR